MYEDYDVDRRSEVKFGSGVRVYRGGDEGCDSCCYRGVKEGGYCGGGDGWVL